MKKAGQQQSGRDRLQAVVARGPVQREAIVAFRAHVSRRHRRHSRNMLTAGCIAAAVLMAIVLAPTCRPKPEVLIPLAAAFGAAFVCLVVAPFWPLNLIRPTEIERLVEGAGVYALGQRVDLRYNFMRPKQRNWVLAAVSGLLLHGTEAETDRLNPTQRQYMREIMADAEQIGLLGAA